MLKDIADQYSLIANGMNEAQNDNQVRWIEFIARKVKETT